MDRHGCVARPHAHYRDFTMIVRARLTRLVVPCVAAALAALGCKGGGEEAAESEAKPVVAVRMATVTEQPFTETISSIGAASAHAVAAVSDP